jgi:type I restriction enzyme S subunit
MGTSLPPYPEYRDSGLAWLPRVPSHWEMIRGKAILREVDERSVSGAEELLTVSHKTGVTPRRLKNVTMFKAESYVGHKLARPNDVVMNIMWAWMAAVGVSDHLGIVSPAYGVYRPLGDRIEPRFMDYLLRTSPLKAEYHRRSKGIRASRLRLYADQFLDIRFPTPSVDEQRKIADYLDAHGRLTSRLIRNRRRLLSVLRERRAEILHRVVMGGLHPNARMAQTSIPWLPTMPAHWRELPIKRLAARVPRSFVDGDWIESPYITSSGVRLVQTGNVGVGTYREKGFRYVSEETFVELDCTEVFPGDLLICRLGQPVGRACLAPDLACRMITSVDVCILKPASEFDPAYLVLALNDREYLGWVNTLVRGSTRDRVSRSMLGSFVIPVPPRAEQEAIAKAAAGAVAPIDLAVQRVQREIELAYEYRERLVEDLVCGARDVQLAPLPFQYADDVEDVPGNVAEDDESAESDEEDDAEVALAEVEE